MTLTLRNPHSVRAALAVRPHDVLEIRLPPQRPSELWKAIGDEARHLGIAVRTELATPTGRGARAEKSERTSAASAILRERPGVTAEELWLIGDRSATTPSALTSPVATVSSGDSMPSSRSALPAIPETARPTPPSGLWLALDCLQDPHNVGAIFRTASFFGVRGILLTRDRSASMTSTVYDVASGGVESVPFAWVPNLAQSLRAAKAAGLWILGSSEHASRSVLEIPHDRPWLLVIGNEETGLRRLTLDLCDERCAIPSANHGHAAARSASHSATDASETAGAAVTSLNASVAAGILIATLTR